MGVWYCTNKWKHCVQDQGIGGLVYWLGHWGKTGALGWVKGQEGDIQKPEAHPEVETQPRVQIQGATCRAKSKYRPKPGSGAMKQNHKEIQS